MSRLTKSIFIITCMSLSFACATPSALKNFPSRQIDRPYALSRGLSTWKLLLTGVNNQTLETTRKTPLQILPYNWEQGITDAFTLIWSPVPVQMKWEFWKNSTHYLGLYGNILGRMWARTRDFNWNPQLSVTLRSRFARDYAMQFDLGTEWDFPRKGYPNWIGEAKFGLLTQLNTKTLLGLKQSALLLKGNPRSAFLGTLRSVEDRRFYWLFPHELYFETQWTEQWSSELVYKSYSQSASRYSAQECFLTTVLYF